MDPALSSPSTPTSTGGRTTPPPTVLPQPVAPTPGQSNPFSSATDPVTSMFESITAHLNQLSINQAKLEAKLETELASMRHGPSLQTPIPLSSAPRPSSAGDTWSVKSHPVAIVSTVGANGQPPFTPFQPSGSMGMELRPPVASNLFGAAATDRIDPPSSVSAGSSNDNSNNLEVIADAAVVRDPEAAFLPHKQGYTQFEQDCERTAHAELLCPSWAKPDLWQCYRRLNPDVTISPQKRNPWYIIGEEQLFSILNGRATIPQTNPRTLVNITTSSPPLVQWVFLVGDRKVDESKLKPGHSYVLDPGLSFCGDSMESLFEYLRKIGAFLNQYSLAIEHLLGLFRQSLTGDAAAMTHGLTDGVTIAVALLNFFCKLDRLYAMRFSMPKSLHQRYEEHIYRFYQRIDQSTLSYGSGVTDTERVLLLSTRCHPCWRQTNSAIAIVIDNHATQIAVAADANKDTSAIWLALGPILASATQVPNAPKQERKTVKAMSSTGPMTESTPRKSRSRSQPPKSKSAADSSSTASSTTPTPTINDLLKTHCARCGRNNHVVQNCKLPVDLPAEKRLCLICQKPGCTYRNCKSRVKKTVNAVESPTAPDTKEYVFLLLSNGSSSVGVRFLLDTGADDLTIKMSDADAAQLHLTPSSTAIDDACGRDIPVAGDADVSIIFGSRTLRLPNVQVAGLAQSVIPQSVFAQFGDCALVHTEGNRRATSLKLAGEDLCKHSSNNFWFHPKIPAAFFQGLSGAGFASTDAEDSFVVALDMNDRRTKRTVSRVTRADVRMEDDFVLDSVGPSPKSVAGVSRPPLGEEKASPKSAPPPYESPLDPKHDRPFPSSQNVGSVQLPADFDGTPEQGRQILAIFAKWQEATVEIAKNPVTDRKEFNFDVVVKPNHQFRTERFRSAGKHVDIFRSFLEENERLGFIRRKNPSDIKTMKLVVNMVFAPKLKDPTDPSSKTFRPCFNGIPFNLGTEDFLAHVPCILEIHRLLNPNAKLFLTIDLRWGFWHLCVSDRLRDLLNFWGLQADDIWEWLVMPFGPKQAPAAFRMWVASVFNHLQWLLHYFDDLTADFISWDEFITKLQILADICVQNRIIINFAKVWFGSRVPCLGSFRSVKGLEPNAKSLQTLQQLQFPLDRSQMRRLLGLVKQIAPYVPGLALVVAPLNKLTSDKQPFEVQDAHKIAFDQMRKLLSTHVCLHAPDPDTPLEGLTDISDLGLGGWWYQLVDGKLNILRLYSKAWTPKFVGWAVFHMEFFGLVCLLEGGYDLYSICGSAHVGCDQEPIIGFIANYQSGRVKATDRSDGRVIRWMNTVGSYDSAEFYHVRGIHNWADTLSRQPFILPSSESTGLPAANRKPPASSGPSDGTRKSIAVRTRSSRGEVEQSPAKSALKSPVKSPKSPRKVNFDLDRNEVALFDAEQPTAQLQLPIKDDAPVDVPSSTSVADETPVAGAGIVSASVPSSKSSLEIENENVAQRQVLLSQLFPKSQLDTSSFPTDVFVEIVVALKRGLQVPSEYEDRTRFGTTWADVELFLAELSLKNGRIVHSSGGVYVRLEDRYDVVFLAHNAPTGGHMAFKSTLERLNGYAWWPHYDRHVALWCDLCTQCLIWKVKHSIPAELTPLPTEEIWGRVHLDLVPMAIAETGERVLIQVTDSASRMTFSGAIMSEGAIDCAVWCNQLFSHNGYPRLLVTDQDNAWINQYMLSMTSTFGTVHRFTAPYHAEANAIQERRHGIYLPMLGICTGPDQSKWTRYHHSCDFAINTYTPRTTSVPPFTLYYARRAHTPLAFHLDHFEQPFTNAAAERLVHILDLRCLSANLEGRSRGIASVSFGSVPSVKKEAESVADPVIEKGRYYLVKFKDVGPNQRRNLAPSQQGPYLCKEIKANSFGKTAILEHFKTKDVKERNVKYLVPYAGDPTKDTELPTSPLDYDIRGIVGERVFRNKLQYLVAFTGYDDSDNEWKSAEEITAPILIANWKSLSADQRRVNTKLMRERMKELKKYRESLLRRVPPAPKSVPHKMEIARVLDHHETRNGFRFVVSPAGADVGPYSDIVVRREDVANVALIDQYCAAMHLDLGEVSVD